MDPRWTGLASSVGSYVGSSPDDHPDDDLFSDKTFVQTAACALKFLASLPEADAEFSAIACRINPHADVWTAAMEEAVGWLTDHLMD